MTTLPRTEGALTVALISEVFWQDDGPRRLRQRLTEAAQKGADLALLPEIPLNPWRPAIRQQDPNDAEEEGGARTQAQAQAANAAGIGLVGGIIHRDAMGRRTSRGLVFDPYGHIVARYDKLHLPEEPGFWETSHYECGTIPPQRIDAFGMPVGLQICSDTNRPEGSHLLGAQGTEAILVPRATEEATYRRWRLVFQANALTSCSYVLSVNRPDPEFDVLIGGPSVVVSPDGQVIIETTDRFTQVTLHREAVSRGRRRYPGYLPVHAGLYADAWAAIAGRKVRASC